MYADEIVMTDFELRALWALSGEAELTMSWARAIVVPPEQIRPCVITRHSLVE